MKISVILPTYKEKENIIPLINAIHENIKNWNHEIIVVDDNSPDRTYQAILNINVPYVKPILRQKNKGLAKSIKCGIENSTGNIIIVMDSDFNHQPKYLPFMVDTIKYYDCVSASRFLYGGKMDKRSRHILSWIFNIFVRILTRGYITDNLYGFFAIKKEILNKIDFNKVFWGYGDYCIRLMYYLQKEKVNILQFPAVNGKRLYGEANSHFFSVFWQYFKSAIKLFLKERF